MNFHIHYLDCILLYSGWIPILWYMVNKRMDFIIGGVAMAITQVIFSLIIIHDYSYITSFSVIYIPIGFLIGVTIYYLEQLMGLKKGQYYKKMKMSIGYLIFLISMPFFEEIFFRVAVFEWLREKQVSNMNINLIFVILSSCVLVVNHFQCFKDRTIFFQKLLFEGMILSIVFLIVKSVWITVTAHVVFNFVNAKRYYKIGGLQNAKDTG